MPGWVSSLWTPAAGQRWRIELMSALRYASTVKALAAAAVLDRTTPRELDRLVRYDAFDLVTYSPVADKHVETGLTLRRIAEAAVRHSDNTAGNLLSTPWAGPPASRVP
jgi:beta-lactamase class A